MAWTYWTGVTGMDHDHFIAGPTSATRTNINELEVKAVRRIFRVGNRPYTGAAAYADFLNANGKVLIPCLFDYGEWSGTGPALGSPAGHSLLIQCVTEFANAMQGKVSVVEFVNELGGGGRDADRNVGSSYWDALREVSPILRNAGIEVLMSGPPTGQNKDVLMLNSANTEAIAPFIDGFVLHPYSTNAGTATSPLSASDPAPNTQLGWAWARRKQANAFSAAWTALPIWITEFGWVTKNPAATPFNLVVDEATLTDRITASFQNWETHAEELKLKAACWFSWSDWNLAGSTGAAVTHPFRYSGIRTNELGVFQTGPKGGSTADWDYRIGVQVAQDADTLKPTLAGTLPGTLSGTASGLLQHTPGSTIRYSQGIPANAANGANAYTNDSLYMADIAAAGKRPLACLGIGRAGTWGPLTWTVAQRTAWIQRWVDVMYAAGVRDFEVGNEIEDPVEPYVTDYLDLLAIASPIIRAKDPNNTVILSSTLGPGADQLAWLELVTSRAKWGLVDSAALHPYSNSNATVLTQITNARAAGRIPASKDIHITEIGIGSDNGGSGFTTTEAGQKTFLTSFFNSLTKDFVTTNRIRLACIFVYANYLTAGDTTGNWDNYAGLRRANGNYKPAWDAAIGAGYSKGLMTPWYYKNGGGQGAAIANSTGRAATALEAINAFGEGTVGTGSAPVSVTGVADQVLTTTARLKGTVDPNSLGTTWFYEYSTEPLP